MTIFLDHPVKPDDDKKEVYFCDFWEKPIAKAMNAKLKFFFD